jgi:hypothetical protein
MPAPAADLFFAALLQTRDAAGIDSATARYAPLHISLPPAAGLVPSLRLPWALAPARRTPAPRFALVRLPAYAAHTCLALRRGAHYASPLRGTGRAPTHSALRAAEQGALARCLC